MAGDLSSNNIRIGANIAGLLEGMKRASAAVRGTVLDMNSKLVDSYKRANKEQAVFRGGLIKLGDDLQGFAGKMALVGTLPALFAAGKSYKDFGELEKLERGLIRYGETIEGVREIAKLPNVGVFDAAKNLIGLKAMKMESDLATRSIKAFANAITDAGGSAVDLDPALVNLKQFKSTRNINTVDVRQLGGRIPQTMDALQSAFKTTDAEKLNKIMAKIGTDGFIEKFIVELEKIPPAAGGAATAQEQLSDSFLFFSGTIGKGLDSALGITDAIKGLGATLDNLSTNFTNLTPEAQKSIFALGAVVVIMPAIIGAVGGLIKLLPFLSGGLASIAGAVGLTIGPFLAVAAGVAIATAAIITNWDSIKKFLTETSWWNTFAGITQSALGIITEAFKLVVNLIQGDWTNLGKSLVNILKNAANAIVTTLGGIVKAALGVFSSLTLGLFAIFDKDKTFGDVGRGVNAAVGSVDKLVNKFKFDVPDAVGFAKKGLDAVTGTIKGGEAPVKKLGKAVGETAEAYVKMTEAAFKMWQIDLATKWYEEQKALKDKIQGYKELLGVTANLNVELIKLSKPSSSRLGDTTTDGLERAKSILGGVADRKTGNTLDGINAANSKSRIPGETRLAASLDLNDYFGGRVSLDKIKAYFEKIPQIAGESSEAYGQRLAGFVSKTVGASEGLGNALRDMVGGVAVGFGEMLGDLMSGLGGVETFAQKVLGLMASMLKDMGKSLIAFGTAGIALKVFMKNPVTALVAGIALTAAGQALGNNMTKTAEKGSMTAFASGGFAYKDMVARVGDNRNARFDPEMIAPYSKVDKSIKQSIKESGGGSGGGWEQTEIVLDGDKMRVILERNQQKHSALF